MTTITIDRKFLEEVVELFDSAITARHPHEILRDIRAALAAPATAPEFPADWAQMIHYPECWDTAAYPELRDAIHEALAWSGCSVCKPATAPAWHVAPTVPGLWLNSVFMKVEDVEQWHIDCQLHLECARWFGPIPPDGDKP